MKQAFFGAAALAGLMALAPHSSLAAYEELSYEAYGQIGFPCGRLERTNESGQYGPNAWLQYTVTTTGALDACGQWFVVAAGSVSGVAESSLSRTNFLYASAQKQVPVPRYNETYTTNGVHMATTVWPFFQVVMHSQSEAYVKAPDPEPDPWGGGGDGICEGGIDCSAMGGNGPGTASPIIISTGAQGYTLTSAADGVWFDIDADGIPDRVAWTRPDSDDAFLVMDRNGNGIIDDGSELFGNYTPVFATGAVATASNGFEALKFLEWAGYGKSSSPAQVNEIIDAHDAAFGRLMLWRDANHNGFSEPDELTPLTEAGIRAIFTDYKEIRRRDRHGNEFRQMGRIQLANGRTVNVYDVWLRKQ